MAGNTGSDSISISIDKTAPTIHSDIDKVANLNGWFNTDVTVTFSAYDQLSGLASSSQPVLLSEGADQFASGTATDRAGNSTSTTLYGINVDKTAPTIEGYLNQAANSNGWFNTDVTVTFSANDQLSGVASSSQPVLLGEGADQSVNGTATDNADNSSSTTISGINIDKTAPIINGFNNGDVLTLNQIVNWTASDNLSGLASGSKGALDTSKVGTYTISAIDNAGNTIEKSYKVIYDFGGILQPIKANGTSVFKAGSTVPVKFQLKDANGEFITNAIASIKVAKWDNIVWGTHEEAISTSAATIGNLFRYDAIENQYIFNLSTKGMSSGTYLLVITLSDGTTKFTEIGLK
jgi:hypothetical protein